jgi:hypothetical protein
LGKRKSDIARSDPILFKVSKLSGKRTVTGQNSGESLYEKAPTGKLLIKREWVQIFIIGSLLNYLLRTKI